MSFKVDGAHKFVVDKLKRGSIINLRGIFVEETTMLDWLAVEQTQLLVLKMSDLRNIAFYHPALEKSLGLFENRLFTKNKVYHLDYVRGQYSLFKPLNLKTPDPKLARAIHRRTVFKNMVLKEIFNARSKKKKGSIMDVVNWWKK